MTAATIPATRSPLDVLRSVPLDTVGLALSLLLLLLYGPREWYVQAPLTATAMAGLIWRELLYDKWLWLVTGSLLAAGVYLTRFTADNHKYLMAYWAFAICLSVASSDPGHALRRNARALIGLVFLFATGWKLVTPEFVSGAFLEFEMLTDERFAGFTTWVAGVPAEVLAANRTAIAELANAGAADQVALGGAADVRTLARCMSIGTLVVEGWVAVAFLLPRPTWLARTRDVALLAFVFTTYAVATVAGFAYLLIAMGLVQYDGERRSVPWLYVGAALAIQLYTLPWSDIATRLLR